MSSLYTVSLPPVEEGTTYLTQSISAGNIVFQLELKWASASAEQYGIITHWLDKQALSDPMLIDGAYSTNYDWLNYYLALSNYSDAQLMEWLNDDEIVKPKSLLLGEAYTRLTILKQRIAVCLELNPIVTQYEDCLRWQFKLIYGDEVNVGIVEPGGWYRNQDTYFSVRFVSELPVIGYNDLSNVTIEIEVYND